VTRHHLFLLALLLLAFWLGARGLDADPLWGDELSSIRDAGGAFFPDRSPAEIWSRVARLNPWHTPGYFVLLSGWGAVAGWTPFAGRALSLLLGVVAIAATYRLARDLASREAALVAAAVLATSVLFIHYLHELRMYSLFPTLTALALLLYTRLMVKPVFIGASPVSPLHVHARFISRSRSLYIALTLCALAMLYTHYFAALPLAVICLWHLWAGVQQRDGVWWRVTFALAAAGALYLPWLGGLLEGLSRVSRESDLQAGALSPPELLAALATHMGNGFPLIPLLVMALALFAAWRDARARRVVLLSAALLVVLVAANALVPVMNDRGRLRYALTLWPLWAVLAGVALTMLLRGRGTTARRLVYAALTLALLVSIPLAGEAGVLAGIDSARFTYPVDQIAREVRTLALPDDAVVAYLPEGLTLWEYSTYPDTLKVYFDGAPLNALVAGMTQADRTPDEERVWVMDNIGERARVWLAYQPNNRPTLLSDFEAALQSRYAMCHASVARPALRVDLYAASPACCIPAADSPRLVMYAEGIALTALSPLPDVAGDMLTVSAGWEIGANVPPHTYSAALHVLDRGGELVAQADYGLPPTPFNCVPATLDLSALPAGEYTLAVVVYAWESGARLIGTHRESGGMGERITLATFRRR
jgi:uncharacterized membrane protein